MTDFGRNLATDPARKKRITPENLAEGARFQNPEALETIDLDLLLSFRSQSLTEESESDETPIKTDGTR